MFGVLSHIAISDADSRKGRMAMNMDGTCMQGLILSSYQSSTLRYAVAQLQLLMQGSVGVRSYQREIMIEDARFECNYTSTSSITRFNKLCDARAQTLSIASAVLGQLPSLFTRWFARPHSLLFSGCTHSVGKNVLNIVLGVLSGVQQKIDLLSSSFIACSNHSTLS